MAHVVSLQMDVLSPKGGITNYRDVGGGGGGYKTGGRGASFTPTKRGDAKRFSHAEGCTTSLR